MPPNKQKRIEWKKEARADFRAIINYIADDNPDAAQDLKDTIDGLIDGLPQNSEIHRIGRVPKTREIVIPKNYIVVYAETRSLIRILRVLHTSRKWP